MTTLKAKDYSKRSELEEAVKGLVGSSVDLKVDYSITGTDEELQKLQLSDGSIVWGVKCKSTNPKAKAPPSEKPLRGDIHPFGIAGKNNLTKPE